MRFRVRELTDRSEVLDLCPLVDRAAAASMAEFRDTPVPADVARHFFERHLESPQCLVLVAEQEPPDAARTRPAGVCITAPLVDPLLGESVPLICVLDVDPGLRHRGVARELVRVARERLAARGFPALAARAGHNDDALISMGERWGFTRSWELMLRE